MNILYYVICSEGGRGGGGAGGGEALMVLLFIRADEFTIIPIGASKVGGNYEYGVAHRILRNSTKLCSLTFLILIEFLAAFLFEFEVSDHTKYASMFRHADDTIQALNIFRVGYFNCKMQKRHTTNILLIKSSIEEIKYANKQNIQL